LVGSFLGGEKQEDSFKINRRKVICHTKSFQVKPREETNKGRPNRKRRGLQKIGKEREEYGESWE